MSTFWEILEEQIDEFRQNWIWSLFLVSAALHVIVAILSPLTAVHRWYKTKISDGDTYIPYMVGVFGTFQWFRYAAITKDYKLALLNLFNFNMQIFYLSLMYFYRSRKRKILRDLIGLAVFMILIEWRIETLPPKAGLHANGMLASATQVLGSMACLYYISVAVRTKSMDFLPFAPVVFTLLVEFHAIVYGIANNDPYVIYSNILFFTMDGTLCACFFIYSPKLPTSPPPESITRVDFQMVDKEQLRRRVDSIDRNSKNRKISRSHSLDVKRKGSHMVDSQECSIV